MCDLKSALVKILFIFTFYLFLAYFKEIIIDIMIKRQSLHIPLSIGYAPYVM